MTRQQRRFIERNKNKEMRKLAEQINYMRATGMLPPPKKTAIMKIKDFFKGLNGNRLRSKRIA